MKKSKENSDQSLGYLLVLIAGSLWGTIGYFATLLSDLRMRADSVAFFRLLSASIMLSLVLIVKGRGLKLFRITKRGFISCVLIGFISQAVYNISYMYAIEQGGMASAAVFLYTSPIYVALLSKFFFGEALTKRKFAAIAINISGCLLAVTDGSFSEISISKLGIVAGIVAGFTYALLPILSRLGANDEDPFTAAFYGQAFGVIFLFFIVRPFNGTGISFDLNVMLILAAFGIIPSTVGYVSYCSGISKIKDTSIIPVLASVETVVAALIGLAAFNQSIGLVKSVGIGLVLLSIAIINSKNK